LCAVVQVTDVSEKLLWLFSIIKDETSVVITALTWCCTWTQNILPHCTASLRNPSDQEGPTSFSTLLLLHRNYWKSVLKVSVFCAATFCVRESSWISRLTR
jgi:hypothetical protein